MSWAIQVENLSKQYRMGTAVKPAFDSVYQIVEQKFASLARKISGADTPIALPIHHEPSNPSAHLVLTPEQQEGCPEGHFWALRDVSFEIKEGERVGIVGKNGSGKSTLLKILSRITTPSAGQFRFRGRLVSLLEVGTGFHPDLSGRENIILNAKINGMSSKAIRQIYDEIVDFSELGPQIDTPIKRYSSGMYMRLAFSVAAHLESEILIVDEVLAVGDAGFQKKCLDKMLQVSGLGRTLVFVSHDMEAVRKLCSKAILLDHGQLVKSGTSSLEEQGASTALSPSEELSVDLRSSGDVTKEYLLAGRKFCSEMNWTDVDAPGFDDSVRLRRVALRDCNNEQRTTFDVTEEIFIEIEFDVVAKKWPVYAHIYVENLDGHRTFFTMDNLDIGNPVREIGFYRETCTIYSPLMNEGTYKLEIVLCNGSGGSLYVSNDEINFEVVDRMLPTGIRGDWSREWFISAVRPRLQWIVKRIG
jgi:lipopolysaccharide transport system ATP-binding protein